MSNKNLVVNTKSYHKNYDLDTSPQSRIQSRNSGGNTPSNLIRQGSHISMLSMTSSNARKQSKNNSPEKRQSTKKERIVEYNCRSMQR